MTTKTAKRTRLNIVSTSLDREIWKRVRQIEQVDEGVRRLIFGEKLERTYLDGAELAQDAFQALFRVSPRLVDQEELYEDALLNRAILEELLDAPDYVRLHDKTQMDQAMSAMALVYIFDALIELLEREREAVEDSNQLRDQLGEPGDEPDEGEPSEGGEGGAAGGEEGEEAQRELTESLVDAINAAALSVAVAQAVSEAAEELGRTDELRNGIGITDGQWATMPYEDRLELADQLNTPAMKRLATVIGRMKRYMLGLRATRVTDEPHEIYNVGSGDDIRRVLTSELALLATPETTIEFYRRFAESELLEYKVRGVAPAGRGPIIAMIDRSGSMSDDKLNWAVACAESLRRICSDDGRDMTARYFDHSLKERFDFPQGSGDIDTILEFLSPAPAGGTDFMKPLSFAVECITNGETDKAADIVFVTDGIAYVTDEWLKAYHQRKEELGFRTFSIFIGGARDVGSPPFEVLESFSDHVIPVFELEDSVLDDLFTLV